MERRFGGPRRDFGRSGPRRFGGGGGFNDRPREMHKAVCAECGNECEVPFKPTEGRPVFCRDCFQKRNGTSNRSGSSSSSESFSKRKPKTETEESDESEEFEETEEEDK